MKDFLIGPYYIIIYNVRSRGGGGGNVNDQYNDQNVMNNNN